MFHLDEAVLAWCRDVHAHGPDRQARVDELADHVYCEVQAWIDQGFTQQDAFTRATGQLGDAKVLCRQHFQGSSLRSKSRVVLWALLTCNAKTLGRVLTDKSRAWMIIAVSLFFAVLMTAVDKIFNTSETVTNVFLAIWWIPFTVLTIAMPIGGRRDGDDLTQA